jgi:hypothetical protein
MNEMGEEIDRLGSCTTRFCWDDLRCVSLDASSVINTGIALDDVVEVPVELAGGKAENCVGCCFSDAVLREILVIALEAELTGFTWAVAEVFRAKRAGGLAASAGGSVSEIVGVAAGASLFFFSNFFSSSFD